MFCHVYARGKGNAQMIPGWPYSFVAALEPGRTSWTAVLDAVRLGPADDETDVTAAQVREVAERLMEAGRWHEGDPDILIVFDAGYDVTRLAWLLKDLPMEVLGRLRSDRVLYFPALPRTPGATGRPSRHGTELKLADEKTWPAPAVTTSTPTRRYGTATAAAWDRLHPRLTGRAAAGSSRGREGLAVVLGLRGGPDRLLSHLPGPARVGGRLASSAASARQAMSGARRSVMSEPPRSISVSSPWRVRSLPAPPSPASWSCSWATDARPEVPWCVRRPAAT